MSKGDTRKAMITVSGKGWASEEKYPLQLVHEPDLRENKFKKKYFKVHTGY